MRTLVGDVHNISTGQNSSLFAHPTLVLHYFTNHQLTVLEIDSHPNKANSVVSSARAFESSGAVEEGTDILKRRNDALHAVGISSRSYGNGCCSYESLNWSMVCHDDSESL
jgi:hypothetical protein